MPRDCDSYTDYIDRIETNLIRDLRKEYPQIEIYEDDSAADVLETIFEECDQQRFVLYWMNGILFFIRILLQKKIKAVCAIFK